MKLGILGKPQAGKTTIFNAASGTQAAVGDYSQTIHRAVIKVPDQRVHKLAELVNPRKLTFAEIEFLDAPGLAGKGKESGPFEFSADLRQADAFMVVVDAFSPDAQPKRDLQNLIDEMMLLDQAMIESNIERKTRKSRLSGDTGEKREIELLQRLMSFLDNGTALIEVTLSEDELKSIRGYQFLTLKPLLIVVNIGESDLERSREIESQFSSFLSSGKREIAVVCGKVESDLVTLPQEDRAAFMQDLGIQSPAMDVVIQKSYRLLGLISFLTAGEPEVRAWPIRRGMSAHKAAGVIHSDIERGFIRAEVINYDDYISYKTPAAIKSAGKMRLEGKEYTVNDGDVILFRFNV